MARLVHFLLAYDHKLRKLTHEESFTDVNTAVAAYGALEQKHRDDTWLEIVLIGSDSIETIRLTHGNYFNETVDLADLLIAL